MKGMIYKRLALVLAVVSVFSGCVARGVQYRHNGDFYYFEKRYREAAKWYRKAAEQGDAQAQNYLGVMYDKGEGIEQDYQEAAKWYRKAAEQGDAWAQNNLGLMYHNGEGIEQDYQKAVKWYRKAAEQGLHLAHYNLGLMYEFGNGVGQNYKKAYIGYSLAVLFGDGNKAIDKRDKVAKKLSASELAQAKNEAERRQAEIEAIE